MMIIDNQMLWRQYAVALDSLDAALRNCPDELWEQPLWDDEPDQWVAKGFGAFWYLGYHTLFWLDLYLTGAEEGFTPPAPFDLVEMQANETLPRVYTRAELLGYLALCRERYQTTLGALTTEQAQRQCSFAWGDLPYGELLIYTLRHVVEHAAQLHLFVAQRTGGRT
jgi:uncharacterized damage-inducible protein DinB